MKRPSLHRVLLALPVALLVVACGAHEPPPSPVAPRPDPGKSSAEARAALIKTYDQQLQLCEKQTADMDQKLAAAIDAIAGGKPDAAGKPAPTLAQAVGALHKAKVTVTLDVLGSPEMPALLVKDSLMDEGQKLQGAPPSKLQAYAKRMSAVQPQLNTLRAATTAVNATLGASFGAAVQCNMYAKAFTTQLGAMANGGDEPTSELLQEYAKFLQANARSKAVAGASIAMLATLQAGFAGKA
jgi:hypothetical protein